MLTLLTIVYYLRIFALPAKPPPTTPTTPPIFAPATNPTGPATIVPISAPAMGKMAALYFDAYQGAIHKVKFN